MSKKKTDKQPSQVEQPELELPFSEEPRPASSPADRSADREAKLQEMAYIEEQLIRRKKSERVDFLFARFYELLAEALEKAPLDAHPTLAFLYNRYKDFFEQPEEAMEEFFREKGLLDNKTESQLIILSVQAGELDDDLIPWLEKAVELDPKNFEARHMLERTLYPEDIDQQIRRLMFAIERQDKTIGAATQEKYQGRFWDNLETRRLLKLYLHLFLDLVHTECYPEALELVPDFMLMDPAHSAKVALYLPAVFMACGHFEAARDGMALLQESEPALYAWLDFFEKLLRGEDIHALDGSFRHAVLLNSQVLNLMMGGYLPHEDPTVLDIENMEKQRALPILEVLMPVLSDFDQIHDILVALISRHPLLLEILDDEDLVEYIQDFPEPDNIRLFPAQKATKRRKKDKRNKQGKKSKQRNRKN